MNAIQLNELLWRIDPMNTCCAVNQGMENEYLTEARDIAELLKQAQEPLSALIAVLIIFSGKVACLTRIAKTRLNRS